MVFSDKNFENLRISADSIIFFFSPWKEICWPLYVSQHLSLVAAHWYFTSERQPYIHKEKIFFQILYHSSVNEDRTVSLLIILLSCLWNPRKIQKLSSNFTGLHFCWQVIKWFQEVTNTVEKKKKKLIHETFYKELNWIFLFDHITKFRLLTLKLTITLLQFFLKGFQIVTSQPILYFTTSSFHACSEIIAKSMLHHILLSDDILNNWHASVVPNAG